MILGLSIHHNLVITFLVFISTLFKNIIALKVPIELASINYIVV